MKVLFTIIAASALLLTTNAFSADAKQLAQKSGCLACHAIDGQKILGPNYKDVAAKYKGDKSAEAKMIAKVKAGGSGTWGPMPMPANSPQVKDDDIKSIVQWILAM